MINSDINLSSQQTPHDIMNKKMYVTPKYFADKNKARKLNDASPSILSSDVNLEILSKKAKFAIAGNSV